MSYSNYRREDKKFTKTYTEVDIDASKKETSIKSFENMKSDWKSFCSYYREYPDHFIDLISPPNSKIQLYFYQRMMLRILFRYQNVYITMTRGTAKSYTQILALYLKCMMFPSIMLFLCAPTAKQAASITKRNIEAIWSHFPLLKDEVAKEEFQKDYTRLIFKNGSQLEVIQVAQSSRGTRAHGGSIEEIVDEHMKKDVLNEVVIPTMANDRRVSTFGVDKSEVRKSVAIVTTCGTRQAFAYEKLMEVAGEMARGENSFILGSGYELPVMHDQLELEFINGLKRKDTFNPLSFSREYESVWTGSSDNSLVSYEDLVDCRILKKSEEKNTSKEAMYVLSYDVARSEGMANANSALVVIKCITLGDGTYSKHIVNIFSFEGTHFLEQAKFLKKKVTEYKASILVIDSNGLGKGLVDFLVTEIDDNPPYSVVNDDRYNVFKTANSIPMIYSLNSSSKENKSSDIHNLFINSITNKKVKFLVSESQAKGNSTTKNSEKLSEELIPHILTDLFVDEVMNLEYKQSGNDTQVKQISKSIPKDKFSAVEYGLWYISTLEKKNQMRKREVFDVSQLLMFKKPSPY
jgi:hypothetical protein